MEEPEPYGFGIGTCAVCDAQQHVKCPHCKNGWLHVNGEHIDTCAADLVTRQR